ncbi:hypothetical protein, partial [Paracidovorax anthurii]
PTSPRSRPGMAQDHMPPRRTASAPAGSAQFTDRRGTTSGSRPGGSTHGAQARKPDFQAGSAPDTPAMKLLSKFQLNELDQMNDAQLQKVVDFLGAKDEGKTQAPLGRNWQRLRSAFNDQEVRKLLLKDTAQVVDFMLQPAQTSSAPDAPAMKLLSKFQLSEIDQMNDAQLQKVVDFLGAKNEGKTQAPLGQNWQRLRSAFNDQEVRKLLLKDTAQVVDFMLQPAQDDKQGADPKPDPQPDPRAGTGRKPEPDPGTGPRSGARPSAQPRPNASAGGFRQEAPRTTASAPKARPAPATPKPTSIVGMSRQAALQALKDRGMTGEKLQEMRNDVLDHIKNGNMASGTALSQKYKAVVTDDFSLSDVHKQYAKLFLLRSG